jgi:hypothetical protein
MRGKRGTILLVRSCVEGAREDIAVKTAARLEEWVRAFNAIADEWGEFLTSIAVRDSKKVARGVREVSEIALEIALPARAWMNTGLGFPILFVVVKSSRPIGG